MHCLRQDLQEHRASTAREFDAIRSMFARLEDRLDRVDGRLDRHDGKFDQREARMLRLKSAHQNRGPQKLLAEL